MILVYQINCFISVKSANNVPMKKMVTMERFVNVMPHFV